MTGTEMLTWPRGRARGLASAVASVGACALAACVLAACGGSSAPPTSASSAQTTSSPAASAPSTGSTSTGSTTAASQSSPTPPAQGGAAVAALTAPGTGLKPGQTAVVEYETTLANGNSGPSYRLKVTVKSITAGSIADFKGVSLTGVPKGASPTYVKLEMTNVSGRPINTGDNDPAFAVQAIEANGQMDNNLIIAGYFPPCPSANTPNPFAAGQTFKTCETYMEHGEATKIGYNGSSATLESPIIWSP